MKKITNNSSLDLLRAAQSGDIAAATLAIQNGADLNSNPLNMPPLKMAVEKGWFDFVKFLVESGANVNVSMDEFQATALMVASKLGHAGIVDYLISKQAKINLANTYGITALYSAMELGNVLIVERLLAAGANVNALAIDHSSPLFQAALYGHLALVQHLLQADANPNQCAKVSPKIDKAIQRAGLNIGVYQPGETPLFVAIRKGFIAIVDCLIAAGAKVNIASAQGFTPLYVAVQNAGDNLFIVQCLIAAKANIHFRTKVHGCNTLHMAVISGNLVMVQYLVEEAGADPNTLSDHNLSALYFAIRQKSRALSNYLINKTALLFGRDVDAALKIDWLDLALDLLHRIKAEAIIYHAILEVLIEKLATQLSAANLVLLFAMVEHIINELQAAFIIHNNKSTKLAEKLILFCKVLQGQSLEKSIQLFQLLMAKIKSFESLLNKNKTSGLIYGQIIADIWFADPLDLSKENAESLLFGSSIKNNTLLKSISSLIDKLEKTPPQQFLLDADFTKVINLLYEGMISNQTPENFPRQLAAKIYHVMEHLQNEAKKKLFQDPHDENALLTQQHIAEFFPKFYVDVERLALFDAVQTTVAESVNLQQQIELQQNELNKLQATSAERLRTLSADWRQEIIKKLQFINQNLDLSIAIAAGNTTTVTGFIEEIVLIITSYLKTATVSANKLALTEAQRQQYHWNQLLRYRQYLYYLLTKVKKIDSLLKIIHNHQASLVELNNHLQGIMNQLSAHAEKNVVGQQLNHLQTERQRHEQEIATCYDNISKKIQRLLQGFKNILYFIQFASLPVKKDLSTASTDPLIARNSPADSMVISSQLTKSILPVTASPVISSSASRILYTPVSSFLQSTEVEVFPFGGVISPPISASINIPQAISFQQLAKYLQQLYAVRNLLTTQPLHAKFISYLPHVAGLMDNLLFCLPRPSTLHSDCTSLRNFFAHGFHTLLIANPQSITIRPDFNHFLQETLSFFEWMLYYQTTINFMTLIQLPDELKAALEKFTTNSYQHLAYLSKFFTQQAGIQLEGLIGHLLNKQRYLASRSVHSTQNLLLRFSLLRFKELIQFFYYMTTNFQLKAVKNSLQNPTSITPSYEENLLLGFIFLLGEAVQQINKCPEAKPILKELIDYYLQDGITLFKTLWLQAQNKRNQTAHGRVLSVANNQTLLLDLVSLLTLRGQALDLLRVLQNLMERYT